HIITELHDEKIVVKSKSNTAKEIDLAFELESSGVTVIETDIGDRILQISNETSTHPTGPISHMNKIDIAEHASKFFEREISPEAREIVEAIKADISEHIKKAGVSITGANAISAEEGAVLLIHNEGNILEVMMRTDKHIIITGTDKIYRNLDEALNAGKLQTFYATGALVPSFINIIGGPSKTADIEKQLIKGVHGPKEIVLILLDNKRSEVVQKGFKELLYCIGCGSCLLHCPVYNFVGDKFANGNKLGGKGIVHSAILDPEETDGLSYCVTCARCRENCPVRLDIPEMMKNLREEHSKSNAFLESHLRLVQAAARFEVFLLLSKVLRNRKP
ncbi:LUD domain-containing protein, partial [archaeon]|nr:LUD domain-containing protein [archaeon]